jgi:hypothetical protein
VRDPGTLGRHQLATGPEILAKRVAGLHPHTITPRDVLRVALALPGLVDLWLPERSRATLSA